MEHRKFIFRETGIVALGQLLCTGAMVGIFALLGQFSIAVIIGGAVGAVMSTANFLFMAIGTSLAADKAEKQDVKGGQALIKGSYLLRMVVLFVVLFAFAKSGIANPIALVLPLVFVRPILTVPETGGSEWVF